MRKWLKDLRVEKGLTMKELGGKLHISESYYCAIESGDRQKNMDVAIAVGLAEAFGVPISRIIELDRSQSTT